MRKIIKTLCLVLAVLLALGLSRSEEPDRMVLFRELNRQAETLDAAVAALDPEQITHQKKLAKWYNYNLGLGTQGLEGAYGTILNFGEGRMAVLGVPDWGLRLPVYHGSGGAVNHDPATALPLGGRGEHTVLYLTEELPWMEGQSLYIDCLGSRLSYRVESIVVTDAIELPERDENQLTLVFAQGDSYMLIRCVRCGELVLRQGEKGVAFPWAAPAAAMPVLILFWIWRGKTPVNGKHKRKNWGLCRKNREKTKLS